MSETHTVTITPTGEITIAVNGVKGKTCKDATRQVEQALGKTASDTPTGEMYEQPITKTVNQ